MLAVEGRCIKNGSTKGTLVGASCGMLPPLLPFDVRLLHQLNLLGCGNTALAFSLMCLQKVEALVRFTWKKLSKKYLLKDRLLGYLLIHAPWILGFRILGLRILNPRTEDP